MNPEIATTRARLMKCYVEQRAYLASKPNAFLEDLKHEAQSVLSLAPENLVRVAAVFNQAAAESILEARQAAGGQCGEVQS